MKANILLVAHQVSCLFPTHASFPLGHTFADRNPRLGDLCLANGLCQLSNQDARRSLNTVWSTGCTDPTYKDPSCPRYCSQIARDKGDVAWGAHVAFKCPGKQSWCCGTGAVADYGNLIGRLNSTCCGIDDLKFNISESANAYTIAAAYVMAESATSSAPTQTMMSTASVTAIVPSSSPSAQHNDSKALELGLGIGIGLGIPLLILLSMGIIFLYRRKRRSNTSIAKEDGPRGQTEAYQYRYEADGREIPFEMGIQRDPVGRYSKMDT
jgi:hypothetical protein